MDIFNLLTPVSYWLLIILWSTIIFIFFSNLKGAGQYSPALKILLIVLTIDAFRTLFESTYFGIWYSSLAGFLPEHLYHILIKPEYVFIPKVINVMAAILVLGLLLRGMIPAMIEERKKQAEQIEQLTRSQENFRQLAENINEVFWLGSPDWNEIYYVSPVYENQWGMSAEQLYAEPRAWLEAVHPDDQAGVIEDIPESPEAIGDIIEFREYRIRVQDGNILWIKARAFPIRDDSGNIVRIAGIAENITAYKEAEQHLRRIQKLDALGKLTGGIAHDYNNMLGIILGYSELLENALKDNSKLSGYSQEISRAGQRGAKLTRKLMEFSRKEIFQSEVININTLLKDIRHMLEKTLTVQIKLDFDFGDDLWMMEVDKSDLENAIVNLAINARQAMKNGGQLMIKTRNTVLESGDAQIMQIPPGSYISVSISDTGSGMDEETQQKIFEPFYTTKGEFGNGLGLSQVHGFVNRSEGAIKVLSTKGKGSEFILYFPRYQAPEQLS